MFNKLTQLAEAFWRVMSEVHDHLSDPEKDDDTDPVINELAKLTNQQSGYGVSINDVPLVFQQGDPGNEFYSFPLVIAKQYDSPRYGEVIFLPFIVTSEVDEDGRVCLEEGDIDLNGWVKVRDVYRFVEPPTQTLDS